MSLIPGGRADKFGNIFERLWVVSLAMEVIDGRLSTIKWEPLGVEGKGVECVVTQADGWKIYHQCKIQKGNGGSWSVADLGRKGVLQNAKEKLVADPRCKFVFISDDTVPALRDMANHARTCDQDPDDFCNHCLTSKPIKDEFTRLREYWGLDSEPHGGVSRALGLLARMEFRHGYRDGGESELHRFAESIINEEGKRFVSFLGGYLETEMGNTKNASQLISALHENGYSLCDLRSVPNLPSAINNLKVRFREALVPHLIDQKKLKRSESEALLQLALAPGKSRLIFVTGEPGSGKSGVLLQLIDLLDQQAVPHLPIRLDTDYPETSVRTYSKSNLDLPHSPSQCLRRYAGDQRAVLLIDQLDAIRWTSRNSEKAWEICKEILDDALRTSEISVVVVGRTMDFEDDPKIKHWKQEVATSDAVSIEGFTVGALPEEDVAALVENHGMIYTSLLPKEKEILRNCQNLRLWTELAQHGTVESFSNRAKLLQKVWEHYKNKAFEKYGLSNTDMHECLEVLVSSMETHGRLDAPRILTSRYPTAVDIFQRLGIISIDGTKVRFSHQSHLDYLITEAILHSILQGKEEPINWLRISEQSLGRRDQVRLLLQLIREADSDIYLSFLRKIFSEEGIRFHIQHLALATLGQVTEPMDGEVELVKSLWEQEAWRSHVLEQVLMGHRPWLVRLTDDGSLPALLASQDASERNQAIRLCKGSATAAPEWFEQMLAPYWSCAECQWRQDITYCLSVNPESDTETVFGWRLELARQGLNVDEHYFELYLVNRLANHNQVRACALLSAVLEGYIQFCKRVGNVNDARRIEIHNHDFNYLLNACQSECREFWHQLIPVFRSVITLSNELQTDAEGYASYGSRVSATNLTRYLAELLQLSAAERLKQEGMIFIRELEELNRPPASSFIRQLIVNILSEFPASLADEAIGCFLQIESPLDINIESHAILPWHEDCLSPQDPAINVFARLAEYCSLEHFDALEDLVLSFHADYEKKDLISQLADIQDGMWRGDKPNHYGLPQYALLLALPAQRLSDRGTTALRTWRSKFGDLQNYRNSSSSNLRTIISPIHPNRVRGISDESWIKLVLHLMTRHEKRSYSKLREVGSDFYIESSPERLSASLQNAALYAPQRYLQLGLRFPANSPSCVFAALLHAGAATEPPATAAEDWMPASALSIEDLLEYIDDKMNREIAISITHLIRARPEEAWSDATLEQLRIYALQHPEPDSISGDSASVDCLGSHDLGFTILNTVRCRALSAAAQLLWANPLRFNWVTNLAEDALSDSSPAVLAAILELAHAIGKHDLNLACSLLVRACAATDVPIISSRYGQELLQYVWRQEAYIEPILTKAFASTDENAVELAVFWSTIGCVTSGIYQDLADQAASGPPAARVGIVNAMIALHKSSIENREECLSRLVEYMNDDNPKVLGSVARLLGRLGFLDSPEAPEFVANFASSAAFRMDPSALLHSLDDHEGSLLPFSDAIARSVAQLAGPLADVTRNPAGRQWGAGLYISKLLLRLYDQSEAKDHLRAQCLNHWDSLLRADVGSHQHVLMQIDSR